MQSNQLLYKSFPGELSDAYREAMRAGDWSSKHGALLDYFETVLWYLTALCLSDYRTRSSEPVAKVEKLIKSWRNKNLTLGRVLDLLRHSVAAIPDPLIPPPA